MRKCLEDTADKPEADADAAPTSEKPQVKAKRKAAEPDAESSIDAEKKQTIKKLLEEMKHEANLD